MGVKRNFGSEDETCPKCGCPELLSFGRQTPEGLRVVTSCPGCSWVKNEPEAIADETPPPDDSPGETFIFRNVRVPLPDIKEKLAERGLEVVDRSEGDEVIRRLRKIEAMLDDTLRTEQELRAEREEAGKSRDKWIEAHAALTVRSALERAAAKSADLLVETANRLLEVAVLPSATLASAKDDWLAAYDDRARTKKLIEQDDKERNPKS